jgi:hypothetical protein
VGALAAVDEPPAAGLDAGVAVHALGAGLDAAAEEAPVSWVPVAARVEEAPAAWVLVVASLGEAPVSWVLVAARVEEAPAAWVLVVVVVVVLVGAAAVTGLRLRGTSSLLLEDRRPAARLGKSERAPRIISTLQRLCEHGKAANEAAE